MIDFIYFISDTHFGHENIIKMCNRPFDSIEEMDETLISNWNNRVKNNDTAYILGDLFYRSKKAEEILARLKGKKKLVAGNHDSSWLTKFDASKYFASIDKFLEVSDGQRSLTLCHYPLMTWKHSSKSYMVHGHIHNDTKADYWSLLASKDNILNASVDINNFMPVTFDELLENNRKFKQLNML